MQKSRGLQSAVLCAYGMSQERKMNECGTHTRPSPRSCLCVVCRTCTISTGMSLHPIHSKSCNALNAGKDVLNIPMMTLWHWGLMQKPKLHTNHKVQHIPFLGCPMQPQRLDPARENRIILCAIENFPSSTETILVLPKIDVNGVEKKTRSNFSMGLWDK